MKFYAISENHLYRSAFRSGRRKSSRSLAVYVLRDKKAGLLQKAHPEKKPINRIGIQASKKVGGAVARNRAKRVIREAYRRIDGEIGVKTGWLVVITPFPAAAELRMQDVHKDLRYCLGQLDMLQPKRDRPAKTDEGAVMADDGAADVQSGENLTEQAGDGAERAGGAAEVCAETSDVRSGETPAETSESPEISVESVTGESLAEPLCENRAFPVDTAVDESPVETAVDLSVL